MTNWIYSGSKTIIDYLCFTNLQNQKNTNMYVYLNVLDLFFERVLNLVGPAGRKFVLQDRFNRMRAWRSRAKITYTII